MGSILHLAFAFSLVLMGVSNLFGFTALNGVYSQSTDPCNHNIDDIRKIGWDSCTAEGIFKSKTKCYKTSSTPEHPTITTIYRYDYYKCSRYGSSFILTSFNCTGQPPLVLLDDGTVDVCNRYVQGSGCTGTCGAPPPIPTTATTKTTPKAATTKTTPKAASTGTTPTAASTGTTPTVASTGTTPTAASTGTTPTAASTGTTPTAASTGTTPTAASTGTTPTVASATTTAKSGTTPPSPIKGYPVCDRTQADAVKDGWDQCPTGTGVGPFKSKSKCFTTADGKQVNNRYDFFRCVMVGNELVLYPSHCPGNAVAIQLNDKTYDYCNRFDDSTKQCTGACSWAPTPTPATRRR